MFGTGGMVSCSPEPLRAGTHQELGGMRDPLQTVSPGNEAGDEHGGGLPDPRQKFLHEVLLMVQQTDN